MPSQFPSYDRLAHHYDWLSRLVFYKSQVRAQTEQFSDLQNCRNLLIVGGGTGWIVKELNTFTAVINITFVESSIKMINLAQNIPTHHHIEFIYLDIENYITNLQFDAVLTPFLFDNFDQYKAEKVFCRIDHMLKRKAFWLYTDFKEDGKWWEIVMLKSMQLFFRILNVVKVKALPKIDKYFILKGYVLRNEKQYYGGFIEAKTYQKQ